MTTPILALVTGGIRSGKSDVAERMAGEYGASIGYVATGVASDDEMRARIDEHRRRRPKSWITVEAPEGRVAALLESHLGGIQGVLLDDLGGLATQAVLTSTSLEEADLLMERELEAFISLTRAAMLPSVVVTSEVGLSLVPTTDMGRRFIDVLGRANQNWAKSATSVTLVIAGIPLRVK
jgi:adenosylcobinamide kinase/adenosylcobinamide-phosphate guanylyltransferase